MTTDVAPVRLTVEERRALVQASARRTLRRRTVYSGAFMVAAASALVVALVPLASILYDIVTKGWKFLSIAYFTKPELVPPPFEHSISSVGGISNAITGSLLIDGLAVAMAIPISIVLSITLYESSNLFMRSFRRIIEVMVGLPSILFGLFVYAFVVTPMGYQRTALAGAISLALLMVPVMTVAGEDALRSVPATLTEAALALGARRSRIMGRVVLPYALPRVLTGILLSLSRAVGETAPLLLIIGSSFSTHWSPLSQQTTLPLLIFDNVANTDPIVRESAWAIALILVAAVFVINLGSRIIVARTQKGRA